MATDFLTVDGQGGIQLDELYRMTVDRYERLAEIELLDDPQVELIGGLLVRKITKKPRHVAACELVAVAIGAFLPSGWYIREQNPLRIPDYDEPEPDIAVVRGCRGQYVTRHPGPEDVALVVEVADTSLAKDRGEKLLAYARGDVPFYWIVNLLGDQVEVFGEPDRKTGRYAKCVVCGASETVPFLVDGAEFGRVVVADILPGGKRG
ncbi:MAG: Uma2 family endonuclease [Isosphaeraceae bacterium]